MRSSKKSRVAPSASALNAQQQAWTTRHSAALESALGAAVNAAIKAMPDDPLAFVQRVLQNRTAPSTSKIPADVIATLEDSCSAALNEALLDASARGVAISSDCVAHALRRAADRLHPATESSRVPAPRTATSPPAAGAMPTASETLRRVTVVWLAGSMSDSTVQPSPGSSDTQTM